MGMSASQARLLSITARLHDVEYAAQNIQNAKLQLATQEDEAYEEYQKALDATTLTVAVFNNGDTTDVAATFNNLFSVNAVNTATNNGNYALIDSRGRVVVSDEVYEGYNNFSNSTMPQNAWAFAMYMLYGNGEGEWPSGENWQNFLDEANAIIGANIGAGGDLAELYEHAIHGSNNGEFGNNNSGNNASEPIVPGNNIIEENSHQVKPEMSDRGKTNLSSAVLGSVTVKKVGKDDGDDDGGEKTDNPIDPTPEPDPGVLLIHQYLENVLRSSHTNEANQFLNYFFNKYGQTLFNTMDAPDEDVAAFNYYARTFSAIQQHGGCIAISDFNGPNGDAASNSEWLTAMIQSGQMSIEQYGMDSEHNFTLTGTSVAADDNLSFTATTQIDKRALAKAEAEYEQKLRVINRKDDKFDLELNKIETERNALTKEYDSVKKVIDDNIERTFGLFS